MISIAILVFALFLAITLANDIKLPTQKYHNQMIQSQCQDLCVEFQTVVSATTFDRAIIEKARKTVIDTGCLGIDVDDIKKVDIYCENLVLLVELPNAKNDEAEYDEIEYQNGEMSYLLGEFYDNFEEAYVDIVLSGSSSLFVSILCCLFVIL